MLIRPFTFLSRSLPPLQFFFQPGELEAAGVKVVAAKMKGLG